jgi:3-phosphoshikimate 1-carboxyvinyltransferase
MELRVKKAKRILGTLFPPGDKSISHRALMLAAMAEGKTHIANLLTSGDCLSTVDCLRGLGVRIEIKGTEAVVHGCGWVAGFKEPSQVLNVGNSGTTIRVLPGILVGQDFLTILTGDASICSRPMKRIIEPLTKMGGKIWGKEGNSKAPMAIRGGKLRRIDYLTKVASAQVKTSILLAGLQAQGKTVVIQPSLSRDHTERLLNYLEVNCQSKVEEDGKSVTSIEGGQSFKAKDILVAGDISSAAYFIAAALILPKSELQVIDVGVNPTRLGLFEVLEKMGANLLSSKQKLVSGEPVASLKVESQKLSGVKISGSIIPRLIDELPVLAVIATQAKGETEVRDASELRVKETDRISLLVKELRKMGALVAELPDGFIVNGPVELKGAVVDSHGDHRLAMSLAIAGLLAEGETIINQAECIPISYPNFSQVLQSVAE